MLKSISNSSCINLENSLQRDALVEPNIISSTYICTTRMSFSRVLLKSVVSIWPLLKSFLIRKLLSLSYQALGACYKPYSDFLSLKTWSGFLRSSKPGGCLTNTSSSMTPFRNALLRSI
jgi:hypothetical protein